MRDGFVTERVSRGTQLRTFIRAEEFAGIEEHQRSGESVRVDGSLRRRDVEMDLVLRFWSYLKVPRRQRKYEDVLDVTIYTNPVPLSICQDSARKVDEVGVLRAGQL